MPLSRWLVLLLIPAPLLLTGCNEAVSFNNSIVSTTHDLARSGQNFGQQLGQSVGNLPKCRALYEQAVREVRDIIKQGRSLKVPKVKGAKKLFRAFRAYLDVEERMVRSTFGDVADMIGKNQVQRAYSYILKMAEEEKAEIAKLKNAQRTFAQENGLRFEE